MSTLSEAIIINYGKELKKEKNIWTKLHHMCFVFVFLFFGVNKLFIFLFLLFEGRVR